MIARIMRFPLLFLIAMSASLSVLAHGVEHHIDRSDAAVMTIRYSNGKPLAHGKYTLYKDDVAAQTGQTDSHGRIFFLDDDAARWRVEVHTSHGHGLKLDVSLPPRRAVPPPPAAPDETGPNRASIALFGFSLIFGGFGLYQLLLRRRSG